MRKFSKDDAAALDLLPDAWERFERAAGAVTKAPPQPRKAKKKTKAKKKK
jgi:hypothetical protein